MSVSGFHHHFKWVTEMSSLQFSEPNTIRGSRIQDAGRYKLSDVLNGGTVGGELFVGELVNPSLQKVLKLGQEQFI
jgi:hypothetical protein